MVVPAQSGKRWDLVLIWEGALPGAHHLTLLHFANNSFNPQFKHHAFQKAFTARLPPPTPPAKLDRGPALYGHNSLCQPLLTAHPTPGRNDLLVYWTLPALRKLELADSMQYPQCPELSQADDEPSKKKKKKGVQLKWTELEYWNLSWAFKGK